MRRFFVIEMECFSGMSDGVDALSERNPFLPAQLFSEPKFTGTGEVADRKSIH